MACCPQKADFNETMEIKGRCLLTGLPKLITVTSTDGKKAECRLLIGQEAQDQYREQVSNSATIGGIVLFVGLGVVVIVAIVTLASAATA